MTGQLILGNATHRPLRATISVLAVAVEVTLVIVIVGLTSGLVEQAGKRIEGVGADIMLQPPSSSVLMSFSGAPMPIKIGDRLEAIKYVEAVAPVLLQFNMTGGIEVLYGIEPESFRAVSGGFIFLQGHDMQGPDDMLVDDIAAKSRGLHAGQDYRMLDHDFHVVGIVEHGKGARIFVQLSTLQDLTGAHDKASLFFIKCTSPSRVEEVMEQMRAIFVNYEIRPVKGYVSLMTSTTLPGLNAFVRSMITLAVCIGFLVIFLSTYTSVIERTRQIGVLKALGASKAFIVRVLLSETMLMCLAGIVAGIALSLGLRAVLLSAFPTLAINLSAVWMARAAGLALLAGVIGAAYPAWLASRKDPVEALFYD
jgi:putative ABC transport system permease protein